jgi:hypothetical protein
MMFAFYRSQLGGDDARQTQGKRISFENRDLRCPLVPERPKLCAPWSAKSATSADAPIDGPQGRMAPMSTLGLPRPTVLHQEMPSASKFFATDRHFYPITTMIVDRLLCKGKIRVCTDSERY